jgi:hypothetical protein
MRFHTFLQITIIAGFIVSSMIGQPITAQAMTKTQTYTCAIDLTRTDWASPIDAPNCNLTKFDPALGVLQQVTMHVSGAIRTEVGLENRDTAPQTITANVSAQVALKRPDTGNFAVILPAVAVSAPLGVYDGTTDYSGTSGTVRTNVMSSDADTITLTTPTDLAIFTSTQAGQAQQLALPGTAAGQSDYNASANYAGYVDTFASLTADVVYQYQSHDLGVVITAPTQITPNQNFNLDVAVNNLETEATTGETTLVISIPDSVNYVPTTIPDWTATVSGNQLTLVRSTPIPVGQNPPITLVFNTALTTGNLNFSSVIEGSQFDQNSTNNSVTKAVLVTTQDVVNSPVQTPTTTSNTSPLTTTIRTGGE